MIKAYKYLRKSVQNQKSRYNSNEHSIESQNEMINHYAARNEITFIDTFVDEGVSGSTLDRPDLNRLQKVLKSAKQKPRAIVVESYSRFARNAGESLVLIEQIEKAYGVVVISATESFGVSSFSPHFFKLRADSLVAAEYQLRIIKNNIKRGVWSARKQGRLAGKAPWGWVNDKENKNIIKHPEKSKIVKVIIEEYLKGFTFGEIKTKIKEHGFTLRGRDAIKRVLTNPLHYGMVWVPTYLNDEPYLIQSVYGHIAEKHLYYAVMQRINAVGKQPRQLLTENAPLRGIALCEDCIVGVTAGRSKGKLKYYWYYRCNRCNAHNFNAEKYNAMLIGIFKDSSLHPKLIESLKQKVSKKLEIKIRTDKAELILLNNQLAATKEKISNSIESFVSGYLSKEHYNHIIQKLELQKVKILDRINELEGIKSLKISQINKNVDKLSGLDQLYINRSLYEKRAFIKMLFPEGIYITKKGYRTPFYLLDKLCNTQKVSNLVIEKSTNIVPFIDQISSSTRGGT